MVLNGPGFPGPTEMSLTGSGKTGTAVGVRVAQLISVLSGPLKQEPLKTVICCAADRWEPAATNRRTTRAKLRARRCIRHLSEVGVVVSEPGEEGSVMVLADGPPGTLSVTL